MQAAVKEAAPQEKRSPPQRLALWVFRIVALVTGMALFFPPANPGRISEKINEANPFVWHREWWGALRMQEFEIE